MARRTLSANELRRLAEAVDGMRDQPAYIVWGANGPEVKTGIGRGDDVMAECETSNVVRERPRFTSITVAPPVVDDSGTPVTDIASRYDAMFWTEAAVEKFVLPYYLRFLTPADVDVIRVLFNRPLVYAIAHLPLTDCIFLTSVRTGGKRIEALTLEEMKKAVR